MSQFALEIARRLLPAAAGGGRPGRSQHLIIDQCGSTLAVILLRLSHTPLAEQREPQSALQEVLAVIVLKSYSSFDTLVQNSG